MNNPNGCGPSEPNQFQPHLQYDSGAKTPAYWIPNPEVNMHELAKECSSLTPSATIVLLTGWTMKLNSYLQEERRRSAEGAQERSKLYDVQNYLQKELQQNKITIGHLQHVANTTRDQYNAQTEKFHRYFAYLESFKESRVRIADLFNLAEWEENGEPAGRDQATPPPSKEDFPGLKRDN